MLSPIEQEITRKLQEDFPLVPEPFRAIAEELGIPEKCLLSKIQALFNQGAMRRLGAVLHHRRAGYTANAMVVWNVPEERIEDVGKKMASFPQVSHCYQRAVVSGWPYTLYTMLHAKTEEECKTIAAAISQDVQISTYELLFSTVEIKKTSMKYFCEGSSNHSR